MRKGIEIEIEGGRVVGGERKIVGRRRDEARIIHANYTTMALNN